jgi:uncharacterized membrane protein YdjX (TVP38/TMEM64 family)
MMTSRADSLLQRRHPLLLNTKVTAGLMPDTSDPPPPKAAAEPSLVDLEQRIIRWWHPPLVLIALWALYLIGDRLGLRGELIELRHWIESLGVLGPVAFIILYVAATLLGFPGSMLTAAAGALFGAVVGVGTALVASSIALTLAFLIARHLARRRLLATMQGNRRFIQLDRLTARHGAMVVLVIRLINLFPFAMVNYGLGLTRVPTGTYILWSIIGKIPGTVVLVVGVDAIFQALLERRIPWTPVIVVAAVALALVPIIRRMHQWIKQTTEREEAEEQKT